MTDRPFAASQRDAVLDTMLPSWTRRAACAEMAPNRAPYGPAFRDEVGYRKDPSTYTWPREARSFMQLCASCPVRTECLAYAFEVETKAVKPFWASETYVHEDEARFGVFGGVPGRIREWAADTASPLETAERWFRDYASQQGWDLDEPETMTA